MAIPTGTLMHWSMFPDDLKRHIENRYHTAVVCHTFNGSKRETHLAEIARRSARQCWEFRLWTQSCASYS
jgi:hypothetical protein